LQEVLGHCTAELAEAEVLYPLRAEELRPGNIDNHEHAMYGLLGTEFPWVGQARSAELRKLWDQLSEQVHEWPGTVLLSAEALAVIRTPAIRRLLDTLGTSDLDILVTARSLGRSLPSLWQQHIRNGRAGTFDDYLQVLADQRDRLDDVERERELHLWRAFALGRLVRRWAEEVGPGRVRVVTNCGSPPQLLWSRFTQAAGLAEVAGRPSADVLGKRTHAGLTADETILLGSLNYALSQARWSREEAARVRDTVVNDGFLTTRDQRGPKNVIPKSWRPPVARWSREDVSDLLDAGVEVVGDVADLRYEPGSELDEEPTVRDVSRASAVALLAVAAALKERPSAPVVSEPRYRRLFRTSPKASR
jgi:hypothetical protein